MSWSCLFYHIFKVNVFLDILKLILDLCERVLDKISSPASTNLIVLLNKIPWFIIISKTFINAKKYTKCIYKLSERVLDKISSLASTNLIVLLNKIPWFIIINKYLLMQKSIQNVYISLVRGYLTKYHPQHQPT